MCKLIEFTYFNLNLGPPVLHMSEDRGTEKEMAEG